MEEYYFLFGLAVVWTVFAVVQDIKVREVSNWLNFSLVGIALAYRAFYALTAENVDFFVYGLLGFAIFFIVAYGLYYSKIFAGGDAKLLMGYGVILPYSSYLSLLILGLGFIFLLFLAGAVYSLIYSVFLVYRNLECFKRNFGASFRRDRWLYLIVIILGVGFGFFIDFGMWMFLILILLILPLIYSYLRALDRCMIIRKNPDALQEGDWLEEDVRVGGRVIKKSVHGLTLKEIRRLKKARRKVLIKEGIPFTPAFLIALGILIIIHSNLVSVWFLQWIILSLPKLF